MKRIMIMLSAAVTLLAMPAAAQILPSGAQQVQGTEAPNRGYPVSTVIVDASGNNLTSAAGINTVPVTSATSAAGATQVRTTVAASSVVGKASAGNLYGYNVVAGASAGYVLVYNLTTPPVDGTVTPFRCIPLAANAGVDVNMRATPSYFTTGIVVAFSTTGCFTQTLSATAFIAVDVK